MSVQNNSYSQPYFKRLYRFLALRSYLLSLNKSGYYYTSNLQAASKEIGIPYNTLRSDISIFHNNGWLVRLGDAIRLKKIIHPISKYVRFFNSNESAQDFCNHIKKSIFFSSVYKQALKESEKIHCQRIKNKYLRSVREKNTSLGVNQGLNFSLNTISNYFGKSKSTTIRYLQGLKKGRLIFIKNNLTLIGQVKDLQKFLHPLFRNRIEIKDGLVFERLQNSYSF